jgi:hypothetical protein
VPHVLVVAAFQFCDPVVLVVLVKTYDPAVHGCELSGNRSVLIAFIGTPPRRGPRVCFAGVPDMDKTLVDAIEQKRRLRFVYNEKARLVEPQCYGVGFKGTELLRGHQLQGGSEREPLFDVSKIVGLEILPEVFTHPGPHYKKGDSAMKTIFAQL